MKKSIWSQIRVTTADLLDSYYFISKAVDGVASATQKLNKVTSTVAQSSRLKRKLATANRLRKRILSQTMQLPAHKNWIRLYMLRKIQKAARAHRDYLNKKRSLRSAEKHLNDSIRDNSGHLMNLKVLVKD